MHINGTLLDIDVAAPDLVQQLTAGVCALLVGHEELQQAVLGGADLRRSAVDGYPMADRIQAQTTDLDGCFIVQGAGTAQHGLQAGDQLPGGEGLGNVVISADFQSLDLVILLALGGEHDDGDVAGQLVTFQAPRQLDAAGARKHPVQQDEIGTRVDDGGVGLLGVFRFQAVVSGHLQRNGNHLPDRGFVVNYQYGLLCHGAPSSCMSDLPIR